MSNDESTTPPDDFHPLTEAILEAAEDLEKGRPLAAGAELPLNPTDAAWPEADREVPVEPEPATEMAEEPISGRGGRGRRGGRCGEKTFVVAPSDRSESLHDHVGCSATAVLIAIVCMILELSSYGWQFRKTGIG